MGARECGNEPSDSVKRETFLDYLKTSYILKKNLLDGFNLAS